MIVENQLYEVHIIIASRREVVKLPQYQSFVRSFLWLPGKRRKKWKATSNAVNSTFMIVAPFLPLRDV